MTLTVKKAFEHPKVPLVMRVWHVPQLPGKPFHTRVFTLDEAKETMRVLADYDLFQLANNIKGDYANMQGLEAFYDGPGYSNEPDGTPPGFYEWNHEETGETIHEYFARLEAENVSE